MKVLVVQRGEDVDHPYKWEFPGGKIESGESAEEAVIREIMEELEMRVVITGFLESVDHDYGHKSVRLIPFICDTLEEEPVMREHMAFLWIDASELNTIDFAEADIAVARSYSEQIGVTYTRETELDTSPQYMSKEEVSDSDLRQMVNAARGVKDIEWLAMQAAGNNIFTDKLIEYSLIDDEHLAFRSSWALIKIVEHDKTLLSGRKGVLTDTLLASRQQNVIRAMLKILSVTGVEKGRSENVAELCFNLLGDDTTQVSLLLYSMELLATIAKAHPAIVPRLVAALNSPGPGRVDLLKRRRVAILKRVTGDSQVW